jgi:hypothetical protein
MSHRLLRYLPPTPPIPILSTKRTFHHIPHLPATPRLKGKTTLITGASRGIGLAIATTYASHGASKVILIGRNETTLKSATAALNEAQDGALSDGHVYRVGDVADRGFWVELGREWVRVPLESLAGEEGGSCFVSGFGAVAEGDVDRHRCSRERSGGGSFVAAGDDEAGVA